MAGARLRQQPASLSAEYFYLAGYFVIKKGGFSAPLGSLDHFQTGEFLPVFLLQGIGDIFGQCLIGGDGDVFQCIGPFLGLFYIGSQPIGGIFHHGKLDGKLFYFFEFHPGLV